MEQRANDRINVTLPVYCRAFGSDAEAYVITGTVINLSENGLCAKIGGHVSRGTSLIVRIAWNQADGPFHGAKTEEGLRSVMIAEVRWAMPLPESEPFACRVGMKLL